MGNETDPPDESNEIAIVDDDIVTPRAAVTPPADTPAAGPSGKIEVVLPERRPPASPPPRRPASQIVHLGRPKTKSYLN